MAYGIWALDREGRIVVAVVGESWMVVRRRSETYTAYVSILDI
jgi:hypothetical protein